MPKVSSIAYSQYFDGFPYQLLASTGLLAASCQWLLASAWSRNLMINKIAVETLFCLMSTLDIFLNFNILIMFQYSCSYKKNWLRYAECSFLQFEFKCFGIARLCTSDPPFLPTSSKKTCLMDCTPLMYSTICSRNYQPNYQLNYVIINELHFICVNVYIQLFRFPSLRLTAAISHTEVRESPDVSQTHTKAQHGQNGLGFLVPLLSFFALLRSCILAQCEFLLNFHDSHSFGGFGSILSSLQFLLQAVSLVSPAELHVHMLYQKINKMPKIL